MMLARIAPHTPGYDMRPFECPACGHSESAVVHFRGVIGSVVPLVLGEIHARIPISEPSFDRD
jgi:hypothetical protein